MSFEEKKVLVVGTGKSGVAATELLLKEKVQTVLFDANKELDTKEFFEKNLSLNGVSLILGDLSDEQIKQFDIAVLSPGVPTDIPMVNRLRDAGVKIWGEIELAYAFGKGRIIAITGTNGKTTTTALTGEIMADYYDDVRVVGNIGIPYTSMVQGTTEETVTVAEISSFQLETIHEFKPHVSAILNITPDHLNRHHTMENYIKAKEDITKNQTADDFCVLNYEDEVLRTFAEKCPAKVIFSAADGFLTRDFILMVKKSCMHMIIRRTESLTLMTSIFLADIIMRMSWLPVQCQ